MDRVATTEANSAVKAHLNGELSLEKNDLSFDSLSNANNSFTLGQQATFPNKFVSASSESSMDYSSK